MSEIEVAKPRRVDISPNVERLWESIETFMEEGFRDIPVKRFPQYPIPRLGKSRQKLTLGDVFDACVKDERLQRARFVALTILANTRHTRKKNILALRAEIKDALIQIENNEETDKDQKAYIVSSHEVKEDLDWFDDLVSIGFLSPELKIKLNVYDKKITVAQLQAAAHDEKNPLNASAHDVIASFKKEVAGLVIRKRHSVKAKLKKRLKKSTKAAGKKHALRRMAVASAQGAFVLTSVNMMYGNAPWDVSGPIQTYNDNIRPHFTNPNAEDLDLGRERARVAMIMDGVYSSHSTPFCAGLPDTTTDMLANLEHPDAQAFFAQYKPDPTDFNRKTFISTVLYASAYGLHPEAAAGLMGKESVNGHRVLGQGSTGEGFGHYTDLTFAESVFNNREAIIEIMRQRGDDLSLYYIELLSQLDQPYDIMNDPHYTDPQNTVRTTITRDRRGDKYDPRFIKYQRTGETYRRIDAIYDTAQFSYFDHDDVYQRIQSLKFDPQILGFIIAKDQLRINPNLEIDAFSRLSLQQKYLEAGIGNAQHVLGSGAIIELRNGLRNTPNNRVSVDVFGKDTMENNPGVFYEGGNIRNDTRTYQGVANHLRTSISGHMRNWLIDDTQGSMTVAQTCAIDASNITPEQAAKYAPENFTPQADAKRLRAKWGQTWRIAANSADNMIEGTQRKFGSPAP